MKNSPSRLSEDDKNKAENKEKKAAKKETVKEETKEVAVKEEKTVEETKETTEKVDYSKMTVAELKEAAKEEPLLISAKTGEGLDKVKEALARKLPEDLPLVPSRGIW